MTQYTLSPSDLTFLWDGCPFCFYMKVRHKIDYRGAFPGIFSSMGNLTSLFYLDKPATVLSTGLPQGVVKFKEKWVKSQPISLPGFGSQCIVRGRFDAVIAFNDGSYGIVDYKTSEASPEKAGFYSRQLSAYAYALEHPSPGALSLAPITRLGLFIITPQRYEPVPSSEMAFITRSTWLDVPRDDAGFLTFLTGVMAVLEAPAPPQPSSTCGLCAYRQEMSDFQQGHQDPFPGMVLD